MSLLTILIILLVISAFGGFWGGGAGRPYGHYAWSPAAVVLIVLLAFWLLGGLDGGRGPHIRLR